MRKCPKCKATSDEISNTQNMGNALGLNPADYKKWICGKCSYLFNDDEAVLESWYNDADFSKMKLSQIADIIMDDWRDINPYALTYVEAMMNLNDINDRYGQDDATSVVSYFLSNAKKWQGSLAREVKKHLRELLKIN